MGETQLPPVTRPVGDRALLIAFDGARKMAPSPPKPEGLDESYPMWVLPVEKLLELQEWKPHQTMLAEGRLVQYKDVPKDSKIIFISHRMPHHRARTLD